MEKEPHVKPEIAETTINDILPLRQMHADSWRRTYPSEAHGVSEDWVSARASEWTTADGLQKSFQHFEKIFGNPNHKHRVAKLDKRVVGFVHALRDGESQKLAALYVDESFHGTALAHELMQEAVEWLDDSMPTTLEVAVYNERAIRFYQKYGFEIEEGSEHLFAEKLPVLRMFKKESHNEV